MAKRAKRAREEAAAEGLVGSCPSGLLPRTPGPRKTLVFIRHGQSEYNHAVRTTGKDPLIRDAGLTAEGREQARAAREVLARWRAELEAKVPGGRARWLLAVSPLRRALATAAEVWPEAFYAAEGDRGEAEGVRLEVLPNLREDLTGCDDIGSAPAALLPAYPHLERQLKALPEVWWTVPRHLAHLPAGGEAMRESYASDRDAWREAEDEVFDGRVARLVGELARAPEELVVVVAHCNLILALTERLGLRGPRRGGWALGNCEVRVAEGLELRVADECLAAR